MRRLLLALPSARADHPAHGFTTVSSDHKGETFRDLGHKEMDGSPLLFLLVDQLFFSFRGGFEDFEVFKLILVGPRFCFLYIQIKMNVKL